MRRPILYIPLALAVLAFGMYFAFFGIVEPQTDRLEDLEIPFEVQPINM